MKVKGIELMQMIADGKIKDGTEIICCFTQDTYVYNDHNKNLICKGSFEDITDSLILGELITANFEILEDKTEEIEEEVDWKDVGYVIGKIYKEFRNGFEEGYTSKGTNCVTD